MPIVAKSYEPVPARHLAFIGLGTMGSAMAAHLVRAGHRLSVFNRSAAKAQAWLDQRDYVAPDDITAVLPQTIAHRLVVTGDAGRGPQEQVRAMIAAVALP